MQSQLDQEYYFQYSGGVTTEWNFAEYTPYDFSARFRRAVLFEINVHVMSRHPRHSRSSRWTVKTTMSLQTDLESHHRRHDAPYVRIRYSEPVMKLGQLRFALAFYVGHRSLELSKVAEPSFEVPVRTSPFGEILFGKWPISSSSFEIKRWEITRQFTKCQDSLRCFKMEINTQGIYMCPSLRKSMFGSADSVWNREHIFIQRNTKFGNIHCAGILHRKGCWLSAARNVFDKMKGDWYMTIDQES